MRIQADIGVIDIIVYIIIWVVLSILTFGIALFFAPYAFAKFILNRSKVIDDDGNEKQMHCNTDMFGNIGHVILWVIISIVTFGFGYLFYFFKVWNYSLNNTTIG